MDDVRDEFRKLRTEPMAEPPPEDRLRRLGEQSHKDSNYEIIGEEDEMLQMLNEGWELVRELNGDKFLMKKLL